MTMLGYLATMLRAEMQIRRSRVGKLTAGAARRGSHAGAWIPEEYIFRL